MVKVLKSVVARGVPFDTTENTFSSTNVQDAIEEIGASASPGYGFGRQGNVGNNTWLLRSGGVPSNKTGVEVSITNPVLSRIDIGNENINTFDVSIYEHEGDEINLTLLATVSVVSARSATFDESNFGTINITSGRQVAVRVTSGSAQNLGVDITLKGSS